MNENIYVTFHVKRINKELGLIISRYAILCNNMDEALECASDVYSVDGVQYIRLRKSKPLKNVTTFTFENYNKPYKF